MRGRRALGDRDDLARQNVACTELHVFTPCVFGTGMQFPAWVLYTQRRHLSGTRCIVTLPTIVSCKRMAYRLLAKIARQQRSDSRKGFERLCSELEASCHRSKSSA